MTRFKNLQYILLLIRADEEVLFVQFLLSKKDVMKVSTGSTYLPTIRTSTFNAKKKHKTPKREKPRNFTITFANNDTNNDSTSIDGNIDTEYSTTHTT